MTQHEVSFSQSEGISIFPPMLAHQDESNANSKEEERQELDAQIEAFLASGGKIDYVEPNVLADPPKKPTSNYGSQPI